MSELPDLTPENKYAWVDNLITKTWVFDMVEVERSVKQVFGSHQITAFEIFQSQGSFPYNLIMEMRKKRSSLQNIADSAWALLFRSKYCEPQVLREFLIKLHEGYGLKSYE